MMLDPQSGGMGQGLGSEKVRRYLLEEISSERLPLGAKVGSERQLADSLGVSRAVVRQVLAGLADAGLVRRVTGRAGGTFVARTKISRKPAPMVGLPVYVREQGLEPRTTVLRAEQRRAQSSEAHDLNLDEGAQVYVIVRLRLADDTPLSLDEVVLPVARFPGLLQQDLSDSLFTVLQERYDVRPWGAAEQIEVASATSEEAELLNVLTGSSLLSVRRLSWDDDDRPIGYSHELFRADRTRVVVHASSPTEHVP